MTTNSIHDTNNGGTPRGLTADEVLASRREHGENVLTPPKRKSIITLYLEKYTDPIIRILLVAAAISLVLSIIGGEYIETIGIIVAILLATTISFYFERDAAKKFDVLTALGEEAPVKVVRDGTVSEVARRDVVVGDIVMIETGDEIPADGRLLRSESLQVDESSLTGEPIATKSADATTGDDSESAYPPYVVLRSSMVMSGGGTYTVTAVGDNTEIGQVARQATEPTEVKTPLNIQLSRLAKIISKAGTAISIAAFAIFLVRDILSNPLWHTADYLGMAEVVLEYFMMAVTLIVMAVPEGLPMAVTLALALNMRRMLKSNNLVRKMHACETMGATTVICTDKTGTLTQNKMQVAEMLIADGTLLPQAIAANSTAHLDSEGRGIGNPTETALLLWLNDKGIDYRSLRETTPTVRRMPFSTERKYMATVANVDGKTMLFVKGAPEIVLSFCDIDERDRQRFDNALRSYQDRAMRTLAFAYREGDTLEPAHATLQGIAAISDPLRDDVPDAVRQCRSAGIDVKIVTGDTQATAIEIARQTGIWTAATPPEGHITGAAFAAMDEDEAYTRVPQLRVMSRARPSDKQRLVALLQRHGEVVAVTGDGTNDAPALNRAHVGLSLGSGTAVAKNASDITLIDDSFRSIVRAVMWGRSLYRNIQRFIFFQLTVNVAALMLVLVGSLIGTPLPLTVTQILWVNLIMDTFAAMALASLPPTDDVMHDRPRDPKALIITRPMATAICCMGLAFFAVLLFMLLDATWSSAPGEDIDTRQLTILFTVFVMLQWWNLLNAKTLGSCRSALQGLRSDTALLLTLAMVLVGQWLIVAFGGRMFRTVPLTAAEWGIIVASTSIVLWIGEAYRWAQRVLSRRRTKSDAAATAA